MNMRVVARVAAIGLGLVVLLSTASSRAQSPQVQHATVPVGQYHVELWRDPADGELVFQFEGSGDWEILRRRTLYDLIEGRLASVNVYLSTAMAWKSIGLRYG